MGPLGIISGRFGSVLRAGRLDGDPVYASGSDVVILRECLIKKKEDSVENFNFVSVS